MIIKVGYPISTNRYYRTFRNITTISKEGRLFKEEVRLVNHKIKPVANDIMLDITLHPKMTKAKVSKKGVVKEGVMYKVVIDLDNCLKCILDSLIGVVYHDDKQVKELRVRYGNAVVGGGATIIVNEIKEV
jgi:crossover junction endodeoxyribonuclease RusA